MVLISALAIVVVLTILSRRLLIEHKTSITREPAATQETETLMQQLRDAMQKSLDLKLEETVNRIDSNDDV